MDDHSRYSVVTSAALMPGVDWITKSPNGPLIDTGVEIVFENRGHLYLSVETIREMAEVAGLFRERDGEAAEKYDAAWKAGRSAGVEENLNGNLDNLVAVLDAAADSLRRAVVPVEPEPEAEPESAPVVDTSESKPARARRGSRQGDGAPLDEGPALVSAGPSHESFGI